MSRNTLLVVCIVLHACVLPLASAITRTASGNGVRWSSPSTWSPNGVPARGDDAVIPSGANVIFDAVTPRLGVVDIQDGGSLRFDNGKGASDTEIVLVANTILVAGYLEMGREDCLLARRARVVLINDEAPLLRGEDDTRTLTSPPYRSKMLIVYASGIWEAHAVGRTPTWTRLSATVNAGDNKLTVIRDVNWKVGDDIIVATTDYDPAQTERFTITQIQGRTITVNGTFRYSHFGRVLTYDGYNIDMRAEVAVLSSNLIIEGDMVESVPFVDPNPAYAAYEVHYGGHTISIGDSIVRIEGAEFRHLGQAGRLARYPIHWHHRKDAPGQYIKRSSIHTSYSRGVVVHDTNYVLVEETVNYNVLGHSVYLEDGTEIGNQFINNLAVTSRPVPGGNEVGYFNDPKCAANPPGLRLQFLDDLPSGFWITNVNNTFIGNSAVGHAYGFWIRVDFVFSEPGFPCVDCTCPTPAAVELITKFGTGLVMVDNYAHSNTKGGIWIKENWIPMRDPATRYHPFSHVDQVISGFQSYKNMMGLEIYGIGRVHFDHIIAADNAQGILVDWERHSTTNWTKTLIIGETENHGNPSAWKDTTDCSAIFPGIRRTYKKIGLSSYGFKIADKWWHFDEVTFANLLPNCNQQSNNNVGSYPSNNHVGALHWTAKSVGLVYPDRSMKGVKFHNTLILPPYSNAPNNEHVEGEKAYMSGFKDVDGSFPCSTPGSWIMHNTPAILPKDCEYRSNMNLWVCPPFNGAFKLLDVRLSRQFTTSSTTADLYFDWECGKRIVAEGGGSRFAAVIKTDKRYHLSFSDNTTPAGLRFNPIVDYVSGAEFEGAELVIKYPGKWSFEYYTYNWPEFPNSVPFWNRINEGIEVQCACDTTYVKINFKHRWGVEIRANANSSVPCSSTCGNPWPIPQPQGYSCSQNLVSSTKNITSCSNTNRPLQTTPRTWVTRPSYPEFELPRAIPNPISPCNGVATSTSSSASASTSSSSSSSASASTSSSSSSASASTSTSEGLDATAPAESETQVAAASKLFILVHAVLAVIAICVILA